MCIKFSLNGLDWEVYMKGQLEFKKKCTSDTNEDNDVYLGLTLKEFDEVWVWDEITKEPLLYRTIKHELTHVFMESYGLCQFKDFNEENVADFVECYADDIVRLAKKILAEIIKERSK